MREPMPSARVGMRIEHDGRAALQYQQVVKLCRLLVAGIADDASDMDAICIVAAAGAWCDARKGEGQ
jgi:hypothetical protein